MKASITTVVLVLICMNTTPAANAGVFLGTVECTLDAPCAPRRPASNNSVIINPYGIVHPVTFDPAGGVLDNIKICVADVPGGSLVQATEWAVAKWNALSPQVHNCAGCKSFSDTVFAEGTINFASTVLHEIGHCVLGLNHIFLGIDANGDGQRENTDFTISYGGATIGLNDGLDNVRGSKDDDQDAQGGTIAEIVNWFAIATNDPINPSALPVDSLSFSRSFSALATSGSSYSASANTHVGALLGSANTQSVMGRLVRSSGRFDLSPDDVYTVQLARTGLDRLTGTSDDYDVTLEIVPCEEPHDVVMQLGPLDQDLSGLCNFSIDFSSPNPPSPAVANSYKLMPGGVITLNTTPFAPFNFGIPLWYGHFESGTFDSGWTVVP